MINLCFEFFVLYLYQRIHMGRKRIYKTKEEILRSRRQRSLKYYYDNIVECRKKRMDRYHEETKIHD